MSWIRQSSSICLLILAAVCVCFAGIATAACTTLPAPEWCIGWHRIGPWESDVYNYTDTLLFCQASPPVTSGTPLLLSQCQSRFEASANTKLTALLRFKPNSICELTELTDNCTMGALDFIVDKNITMYIRPTIAFRQLSISGLCDNKYWCSNSGNATFNTATGMCHCPFCDLTYSGDHCEHGGLTEFQPTNPSTLPAPYSFKKSDSVYRIWTSNVTGNGTLEIVQEELPYYTLAAAEDFSLLLFENGTEPSVLPLDNVSFEGSPPSVQADIVVPIKHVGIVVSGDTGASSFRGFQLFDISQSYMDLGTLEDEDFSVSFWMRSTNITKGFIFCVTDNVDPDAVSGTPPILEEIWRLYELGVSTPTYIGVDFHVYSAVFVDSSKGEVVFSFSNGRRSGLQFLKFSKPEVFDQHWHLITMVSTTYARQRTVQLFVDGNTKERGSSYRKCFPDGSSHPLPVRESLPRPVYVPNPMEQVVFNDGVTIIGHPTQDNSSFAIYDLRFLRRELKQAEIIRFLGSPAMERYKVVDVGNSHLLGYGLGVIAFFGFVSIIYFWYIEIHFSAAMREEMEERELAAMAAAFAGKEQDEEDEEYEDEEDEKKKRNAGTKLSKGGGKAASTASSSRGSLSKLEVIIPQFIFVIQSMTLYFSAFEWPSMFETPFSIAFFAFSLDMNVATPVIGPLAGPILQFTVTLAIIVCFLAVGGADEDNFRKNTVKPAKAKKEKKKSGREADEAVIDDGLPHPHTYPTTENKMAFKDDKGKKHLLTEKADTVLHSVIATAIDKGISTLPDNMLLPLEKENGGFVTLLGLKLGDPAEDEQHDVTELAEVTYVNNCCLQVPNPKIIKTGFIDLHVDQNHCPLHKHLLIPMVEGIHTDVPPRQDGTMPYNCDYVHNSLFRRLRGPMCETDLLVCPDDSCGYCACAICTGYTQAAGAEMMAYSARQQQYILKRSGIKQLIGLIAIIGAEAVYLPTLKAIFLLLTCHRIFLCLFPDCYSPVSSGFLVAIIAAVFIMLIFGIGLIVTQLFLIIRRKITIVTAGVWDEFLIDPKILMLAKFRPHEYRRRQVEEGLQVQGFTPVSLFEKLFCGMDEEQWQKLLLGDRSMLRGLYEQFEFHHMCIHPIFLLFRFALVTAVLLSPTNSLTQLAAAAFVEVIQFTFVSLTAAMLDPWLDILARAGGIHQCLQLCLVCFHRVIVDKDPKTFGLAPGMIAVTGLYIIVVIVVLVYDVLLPFLAAKQGRKKDRDAMLALRLEERDNETAQRKKQDRIDAVWSALATGKYDLHKVRLGLNLIDYEFVINQGTDQALKDVLGLMAEYGVSDGAASFRKPKNAITRFGIHKCLTNPRVPGFVNMIKKNAWITELNISDNAIGPAQLGKILEAVVDAGRIRRLIMRDVSKVSMQDSKVVIALGKLCSKNIVLEHLDFSSNTINGWRATPSLALLQAKAPLSSIALEDIPNMGLTKGRREKIQIEIAGEFVKLVQQNPHLKQLSFAKNNYESIQGDKLMTVLSELHELTVLDLSSMKIKDAAPLVAVVNGCKALKTLTAKNNKMSPLEVKKVIDAAVKNATLAELNLAGCAILDVEEEEAIRLTIPENVPLTQKGLVLSETTTGHLAKYMNKNMVLSVPEGVSLSIDSFKQHPVPHGTRVEAIEFCGNNGLQQMHVQALLKPVNHHAKLARLKITNNTVVGDAMTEVLAASMQEGQLKRLRHLDISGNALSAKSLVKLLKVINSSEIESLCIGGNGISAQLIKALGQWLLKATALTRLDLNHPIFEGESEEFLAAFDDTFLNGLKTCGELTVLNISGLPLNAASVKKFVSTVSSLSGADQTALKKSASMGSVTFSNIDTMVELEDLDISDLDHKELRRTEQMANAAAELVSRCRSLRRLRVANTLSDTGRVVRALVNADAMQELDLGGCQVASDGAVAWENVKLTHLNLTSQANVPVATVDNISKFLPSKKCKLKVVKLSTNDASPKAIMRLLQSAVRSKGTLVEIDARYVRMMNVKDPSSISTMSSEEAADSQVQSISVSLGENKEIRLRMLRILALLIMHSEELLSIQIPDALMSHEKAVLLKSMRANVNMRSFIEQGNPLDPTMVPLHPFAALEKRNQNLEPFFKYAGDCAEAEVQWEERKKQEEIERKRRGGKTEEPSQAHDQEETELQGFSPHDTQPADTVEATRASEDPNVLKKDGSHSQENTPANTEEKTPDKNQHNVENVEVSEIMDFNEKTGEIIDAAPLSPRRIQPRKDSQEYRLWAVRSIKSVIAPAEELNDDDFKEVKATEKKETSIIKEPDAPVAVTEETERHEAAPAAKSAAAPKSSGSKAHLKPSDRKGSTVTASSTPHPVASVTPDATHQPTTTSEAESSPMESTEHTEEPSSSDLTVAESTVFSDEADEEMEALEMLAGGAETLSILDFLTEVFRQVEVIEKDREQLILKIKESENAGEEEEEEAKGEGKDASGTNTMKREESTSNLRSTATLSSSDPALTGVGPAGSPRDEMDVNEMPPDAFASFKARKKVKEDAKKEEDAKPVRRGSIRRGSVTVAEPPPANGTSGEQDQSNKNPLDPQSTHEEAS